MPTSSLTNHIPSVKGVAYETTTAFFSGKSDLCSSSVPVLLLTASCIFAGQCSIAASCTNTVLHGSVNNCASVRTHVRDCLFDELRTYNYKSTVCWLDRIVARWRERERSRHVWSCAVLIPKVILLHAYKSVTEKQGRQVPRRPEYGWTCLYLILRPFWPS